MSRTGTDSSCRYGHREAIRCSERSSEMCLIPLLGGVARSAGVGELSCEAALAAWQLMPCQYRRSSLRRTVLTWFASVPVPSKTTMVPVQPGKGSYRLEVEGFQNLE